MKYLAVLLLLASPVFADDPLRAVRPDPLRAVKVVAGCGCKNPSCPNDTFGCSVVKCSCLAAKESSCPCGCGCGCKDCSPDKPCDCGCPCSEFAWYANGDGTFALFRGKKQVGYINPATGKYWSLTRGDGYETWERAEPPKIAPAAGATDALDEVNEYRRRRGLRPFLRDEELSRAALACARYRAERLIEGHTSNDFSFVPAGGHADAAGCAAWPASMGWGSCCCEEDWQYAGAAFSVGKDGRRYMHLFVRGRGTRQAVQVQPAGSCRS